MSRDWLIKVDDGDTVDGEGAVAGVNDAIQDGFDVGGVRSLVIGSGGVDGKADNHKATGDLAASPNTTFFEAESLCVGVGRGVVRHVNESRSSGRGDKGGGGWGRGCWEEVALGEGEFVAIVNVVVGCAVGGRMG